MTETAVCGLCGDPMPVGEEMFKHHGYSGPCPKPPIERKPVEYGWVVELAESEVSKPLYWRGGNVESRPEGDETPFIHWTHDHLQAVRFCRREDAEKLKFLSEIRICEHGWG